MGAGSLVAIPPSFFTQFSVFKFSIMSERIGIFIDGGHLRAAVENVFSKIDEEYWGNTSSLVERYFPESKIDYKKLTQKIMEGQGGEIAYRGFYTSPPFRQEHMPVRLHKRSKAYRKFKGRLKAVQYNVREGYIDSRKSYIVKHEKSKTSSDFDLRVFRKSKFEQKAVDTFIARDIATLIAKDLIDKVCLLTSDGDFTPVVRLAKRENKVFTTLWHAQGRRCSASKFLKRECCCIYDLKKIEKEIRRW